MCASYIGIICGGVRGAGCHSYRSFRQARSKSLPYLSDVVGVTDDSDVDIKEVVVLWCMGGGREEWGAGCRRTSQ